MLSSNPLKKLLIIAEESIDNKQLGGVSVLVYYQKGPEIEIIKCNVQKIRASIKINKLSKNPFND